MGNPENVATKRSEEIVDYLKKWNVGLQPEEQLSTTKKIKKLVLEKASHIKNNIDKWLSSP